MKKKIVNANNARRLLNFFRAASGRKLCEDADNDTCLTTIEYNYICA